MQDYSLPYKSSIFTIPAFLVLVIWLIYWFEIQFDLNFNKFGVYPRTLKGIRGVFLSPFIHSNTNHLFNNCIPLFVLTSSLFCFYRTVAIKILVIGTIFTGFLTWCMARESYHIGASGVVYLVFSFVFFSGMIKKHYRLVALSLIIIFLYGSMVWYILPIKDGISWEGHLSGFLVGLLFAIWFRKKGIIQKEYQFTTTEFDSWFDDDGNFRPPNNEIEDMKEL